MLLNYITWYTILKQQIMSKVKHVYMSLGSERNWKMIYLSNKHVFNLL